MKSGILQPYSQKLAQALQVDAVELENALAHRVTKDRLKEIGILEPSAHADHIDINKASGLLLRALINRPSMNDKGGSQFGFADGLSPHLQGAAHALEVQQKKDKLNNALKRRPSSDMVMGRMSNS